MGKYPWRDEKGASVKFNTMLSSVSTVCSLRKNVGEHKLNILIHLCHLMKVIKVVHPLSSKNVTQMKLATPYEV